MISDTTTDTQKTGNDGRCFGPPPDDHPPECDVPSHKATKMDGSTPGISHSCSEDYYLLVIKGGILFSNCRLLVLSF